MTRTLTRTIVLVTTLFATSGCNIKLDAPLLPNVGKHFPEGTSEAQANKDLTSLSKSQAATKKLLSNLIFDKDLTSDLDLDRDNNCVQLSELPDRTVVVDFFNVRCPSNSETGPAANLQFTSAYAPMTTERNHYTLRITGRDVGEMEINTEGTELKLLRVCTGRYDTYCLPSIVNKKFVGPPTLLY